MKLRHAVEVRNDSFIVPEFVALCRKNNVAIVYADHAKYPAIADVTGDFVYARLQTGSDDNPDLLHAEGARRMGGAREDLGGGQGAGRSAARRSRRARRRSSRATCSSTSSPKARCARRIGAMALMERVTG